jgi:hypothetical protein
LAVLSRRTSLHKNGYKESMSAPLVLLGRTEFSCIVFFHDTYDSLEMYGKAHRLRPYVHGRSEARLSSRDNGRRRLTSQPSSLELTRGFRFPCLHISRVASTLNNGFKESRRGLWVDMRPSRTAAGGQVAAGVSAGILRVTKAAVRAWGYFWGYFFIYKGARSILAWLSGCNLSEIIPGRLQIQLGTRRSNRRHR